MIKNNERQHIYICKQCDCLFFFIGSKNENKDKCPRCKAGG